METSEWNHNKQNGWMTEEINAYIQKLVFRESVALTIFTLNWMYQYQCNQWKLNKYPWHQWFVLECFYVSIMIYDYGARLIRVYRMRCRCQREIAPWSDMLGTKMLLSYGWDLQLCSCHGNLQEEEMWVCATGCLGCTVSDLMMYDFVLEFEFEWWKCR